MKELIDYVKKPDPDMYIYKTTNLVNGMIYIGQHKHDFTKKWHNTKEYIGSGTLMQRAIRKYGRDNFEKEILCYCYTQQDLDWMEEYYILLLNSSCRKKGYNLYEGRSNCSARKKTPKQKKTHRQAIIDFHNSERSVENHKKRSVLMKKLWATKEYREKVSQAHKDYMSSPKNIKKRSQQTKAFLKTKRGRAQNKKRLLGLKKFHNNPVKMAGRLKKMLKTLANRTDSEKKKSQKKRSASLFKKVISINVKNGETKTYRSVRSAIKGLKLRGDKIRSIIKSGREINGRILKFANNN